jgi:hypothetical protein
MIYDKKIKIHKSILDKGLHHNNKAFVSLLLLNGIDIDGTNLELRYFKTTKTLAIKIYLRNIYRPNLWTIKDGYNAICYQFQKVGDKILYVILKHLDVRKPYITTNEIIELTKQWGLET